MSRIGWSVSYNTTTNCLHSLGRSAQHSLAALGRAVVRGERFIHIVYDNINQYRRQWNPSLGSKSDIESGTAATLIVQENVSEGAYRYEPFYSQPQESLNETITAEGLLAEIDSEHVDNSGAIIILRIILDNLPELKKRHATFLRKQIDNLIAKHKLKL